MAVQAPRHRHRLRLCLAPLLLLLLATDLHAGPRVLLVGDSWAEFMWVNRTLRDVFAANGRADLTEQGADTAIGGTTAAEWATPTLLQDVTDALANEPTIDTVQVTIGGNDLLAGMSGGGWFVDISQADFDALNARIVTDAMTLVDHVLALRSDLEVVLSLYDYPRFLGPIFIDGCDTRWEDLGQPLPIEVNGALAAVEAALADAVASRSRVSIVPHLGAMQWAYGFPGDGIDPGDLEPPGDPSRPSPAAAMFLGLDCIHLSQEGYSVIGQRMWDGYYRGRFEIPLFADGFESGDTTAW